MASTAFVTSELFFWHDSGNVSYNRFIQPIDSYENAETKRRLHNLVKVIPSLDSQLLHLSPRYATKEEVLAIHTEEYVNEILDSSDLPKQIGHEANYSRSDIIFLSTGAALTGVETIMAGKAKNAYILCRPPGHHATRSVAQGYCFFNNVSIAAAYLHSHFNLQRVAIVDFDVHHGNGTQEQWYSSDKVLFISLHQDGLYPLNSGHVEEVGEGAGKGYNLNVPLPPGSARGVYMSAFESVVIPALRAYKPEFILVSSGLDASFLDPLGRMLLTSSDFKDMTIQLKQMAKELCNERLMFVHEGGYSELYTPIVGVKVIEALLDEDQTSHLTDPFLRDVGSPNWISCQPHQMQMVEAAAKNLAISLIPSRG